MNYVGMFLSGAVLFLNSLTLLGKASQKSVAFLNIIVGTLQIIFPIYLIVTSNQTNWDFYNNAAIFLFGLTFLYVGATTLMRLEGNGLGWFSLWVAIIAIVYTATSFIHFHDIVSGLNWAMWAFLWFLYFIINTTNKKIHYYVGIVACIQSWVTLTIPALLFFLGISNNPSVNQGMIYVLILSILYFVFSIVKQRISSKSEVSLTNNSRVAS
ncbi:acetamide transporter [Robertmurraya yapensis]|uniref:Acetamide transporter n=1 Tax=Bacillus yapensis TaxID=2492960 RepID=A0A431W3P0_9BACI|nr:AmiS/UreI family transporter [Bacillus yapensis]RTR30034.1 acetamide transporter [Bacillus yapensis]TKS95115.1 acetamide transporter [Bacillus yapensis]